MSESNQNEEQRKLEKLEIVYDFIGDESYILQEMYLKAVCKLVEDLNKADESNKELLLDKIWEFHNFLAILDEVYGDVENEELFKDYL